MASWTIDARSRRIQGPFTEGAQSAAMILQYELVSKLL